MTIEGGGLEGSRGVIAQGCENAGVEAVLGVGGHFGCGGVVGQVWPSGLCLSGPISSTMTIGGGTRRPLCL